MLLELLGWAGMIAVFCVAIAATGFGAGLPALFVVGILADGKPPSRRAMRAHDGERDRPAA
ncbi:MAG: hypothetical protein AAF211_31380 [Myxococcota bacterium]